LSEFDACQWYPPLTRTPQGCLSSNRVARFACGHFDGWVVTRLSVGCLVGVMAEFVCSYRGAFLLVSFRSPVAGFSSAPLPTCHADQHQLPTGADSATTPTVTPSEAAR